MSPDAATEAAPPLTGRRIAVIEDDPIMGESLCQRLQIEGADPRWFRDGDGVAAAVGPDWADAVVCDIRLPGADGEAVFRQVVTRCPTPFLFITAHSDIDQAVRLMRLGAGDYLTKPFAMADFLGRLRALLRPRTDEGAGALGPSAAMRRIEALVARLAGRRTSVLLTGETGTGKEVVARHLHAAGDPRLPFVAVNCAAIPSTLMESILFGHERGAFTGAVARQPGLAEKAGAGTLFLDEIGELPAPMQAKLLRLLEERQFVRLGGQAPLALRARIVAATNADLAAAVAEGRFREDLYYRINVVEIAIPPLRARRDDIPWLMNRFLGPSHAGRLSGAAQEIAMQHDWPGNVRELRNRCECALALAEGESILPTDLFPEFAMAEGGDGTVMLLAAARDLAERVQIERALAATGRNVPAAAAMLGVSRSTLFEKLRRLGID